MTEPQFELPELLTNIRELQTAFTERDNLLRFWDALVLRDDSDPQKTGQYLPPPFTDSQTVITHATGIIADRLQFLSAKVAENKPNIVVHTIIDSSDASAQPASEALTRARNEELCLNGIYWAAAQRATSDLQQKIAWSQAGKGVGWYHSYRAREGWAIPSRKFFKDPTDEELEALRGEGVTVTEAFTGGPDDMTHAEDADELAVRRDSRRKQSAVDGAQLYVVEALPPGKVYWREDTDGISMAVIIEEVSKTAIGDDFGVVKNIDGNIIMGRERGATPGGVTEHSGSQGSYTLARVWTREEYYYVIAAGSSSGSMGGGEIIAQGKHKYGQVPLWPAAATETDSDKLSRRYLPAIYGALAIIPGYNQILTLLSNAAIFNTTPRYVLIKPDGQPVLDPDSGEMLTFESDATVGLDPQYISVIEGGGRLEQLKIENIDDLVLLLDRYSLSLDATLPSEAALGSSGSSEPAWGTRLKQAAQAIKIAPLVDNNARAVTGMAKMWALDIRLADHSVYIKTKPHRRGKNANVRGLIELKPEDIHLDISVRQDKHALSERLELMQVGGELLDSFRIDPITYYEDYQGSDDPQGDFIRSHAYQAFTAALPALIANVAANIEGKLLAEPSPAQSQANAELAAGQLPANSVPQVTEAAGIRAPGLPGMGATMNPLNPLPGGNGNAGA